MSIGQFSCSLLVTALYFSFSFSLRACLPLTDVIKCADFQIFSCSCVESHPSADRNAGDRSETVYYHSMLKLLFGKAPNHLLNMDNYFALNAWIHDAWCFAKMIPILKNVGSASWLKTSGLYLSHRMLFNIRTDLPAAH